MQHVGILLSGGLDSAILAAVLKKDYIVHAYTFNQANAPLFAKEICKILDLQYTQIGIEVTNDRLEIFRAVEYLEKNRAVSDMPVYIAITNIPDEFCPSAIDEIPVRPSKEEIETHPWVKAPFANISKKDVLEIGLKEVDVIHELIQKSHSCYNTNAYRCGKCFNCEERAWAFSEIGLIDIGKY